MKHIVEVPTYRVYENGIDPSEEIEQFLEHCPSFEQWYPNTAISKEQITVFRTHSFVFGDIADAVKFKLCFS